MARPLRIEVPGGIHHVAARADGHESLFQDDEDRRTFLSLFAKTIRERGWFSLAYCLMSTHYHLLVETPRTNLSAGMRDLNSAYARRVHKRHGSRGHVYGGRFSQRLVQRDGHLLATVRYIARNPVEAKLCRRASDWPWSSHRALCRGESSGVVDAARLLRYFDDRSAATATERYVELVDADGASEAPGDTGIAGDAEFARWHLPPELPSNEIPRRFSSPLRPPLDEILRGGPVRSRVVTAHNRGYTLQEIGAAIGVHHSTISRWIQAARRDRR
jgi:REP element-mobilizing transposase RayT